jgi:histone acetyltransferase 1
MQEWVADANEAVSLRLGESSSYRHLHTSGVLTKSRSIVRDPKDENYKDIVGVNGDRQLLEPFHPAFTYPIFGDKEVIFGYKGLKVRVSTEFWKNVRIIG